MLTLDRRPGQSIVIIDQETGEMIEVQLRPNNKVTIEASHRFKILRGELMEATE